MHKLVTILLLLTADASSLPAGENPSEKLPAPEVAARQFRIATYDQFRTDRLEYEARRTAADDLLAAWRQTRQPHEHREAVTIWLLNATQLTQFHPEMPLPPLPELPHSAPLSLTSEISKPDPAPSKPAYLDPEAVQALNEAAGMEKPPEAQPGASSGEAMSTILNGVKRVIFGSE